MKILTLLLLSLLISSCSLAPLTSTKSARSRGDGNWEITTGFSPAPTFSAGRGFSKDLDIGIQVETQLAPQISVWSKYSLINNEDKDFSFAAYGGLFAAADISSTSGAFIGPIASYKYGWFETYLLARYNYVDWDAGEISADEQSDSIFDNFSWEKGNISYMQYTLGVNFWFTKGFALNLSGQYISSFDDDIEADDIIPGIEFIWHF